MVAQPTFMAAAAWLAIAFPAAAQPAGIILNAGARPAAKTCVQIEIAGQTASALNCLNQDMRNQALAASGQALPVAPLGAGGPSNATGAFNQFGVAEQYGKNFGVSVHPYRPPPPVFSPSPH